LPGIGCGEWVGGMLGAAFMVMKTFCCAAAPVLSEAASAMHARRGTRRFTQLLFGRG